MSPWCRSTVVGPKPDGSLWLCDDFQKVNEVSEFNGYPMPRLDKLAECPGRAQLMSTLDLSKGYWQVLLTPPLWQKTIFSTIMGYWQYRVLPFCLQGVPTTFQQPDGHHPPADRHHAASSRTPAHQWWCPLPSRYSQLGAGGVAVLV